VTSIISFRSYDVLVSVENEWPPMGKESRHDGAILMRRIEQQRAART
jgi:hypothetical protein